MSAAGGSGALRDVAADATTDCLFDSCLFEGFFAGAIAAAGAGLASCSFGFAPVSPLFAEVSPSVPAFSEGPSATSDEGTGVGVEPPAPDADEGVEAGAAEFEAGAAVVGFGFSAGGLAGLADPDSAERRCTRLE